jgi:glycosyltransferase involved in cell wall biosynthesis
MCGIWPGARRQDVLIVRDLPLCPLAIQVGRQLGIPVILDMAENYPALLQDVWDTGRRGPFDIIVRNPALAKRVERYCLPRVDHILVVIEESAARLAGLGIEAGRVTNVSNTPSRSRVAMLPRPGRQDGPLTMVYLGIMELARGIADLIDAVSQLRDSGLAVRLKLIGGGRDKVLLERRAASLIESGHVEFLGYIPSHAEALQVVSGADIGVIPHHASEWPTPPFPTSSLTTWPRGCRS